MSFKTLNLSVTKSQIAVAVISLANHSYASFTTSTNEINLLCVNNKYAIYNNSQGHQQQLPLTILKHIASISLDKNYKELITINFY